MLCETKYYEIFKFPDRSFVVYSLGYIMHISTFKKTGKFQF